MPLERSTTARRDERPSAAVRPLIAEGRATGDAIVARRVAMELATRAEGGVAREEVLGRLARVDGSGDADGGHEQKARPSHVATSGQVVGGRLTILKQV